MGIKYFTRLRMNFSQLRDHKFKHSFQDTINRFCTCSLEAKTTNHFILNCPYYENERRILLASIRSIKSSTLDQDGNNIVKTLLYGLDSLSETQNTSIFKATMLLAKFDKYNKVKCKLGFSYNCACLHDIYFTFNPFLFLLLILCCLFPGYFDEGNW